MALGMRAMEDTGFSTSTRKGLVFSLHTGHCLSYFLDIGFFSSSCF